MPLVNPYCTLAQVQAECQNKSPEDAQAFVDAINLASRWIESYCRRDFWFHNHASAAFEVPLSWITENVIHLPWPVITLTEVTVQSNEVETLNAADYRYENIPLSPASRIFRAGRWLANDAYTSAGLLPAKRFPLPFLIKLKGTFGYALDATNPTTTPPVGIPHEIARAACVLAAVWSGKARKEIIDMGGQRQQITMKNIPKDVTDMLGRFRVPVV